MAVAGIVAEYNPFHLGHAWQIQELRRRLGADTPVVAVMSGNWVQRGEPAILEKRRRTALALRGGVDLVIELPLTWALASAERFAQGGVGLLAAAGVVDTLVFGSESGDLPGLTETADYLLSEAYQGNLKAALKSGCSFAAARQQALDAAGVGIPHWDTRQRPNDQLGLEYLKALKALGTEITPLPLPRTGAAHNSPLGGGPIASASAIRALLLAGEDAGRYLLPDTQIDPQQLAGLVFNGRGVLSRLRAMSPAEFSRLPDCGEGLENRLYAAARESTSPEQFCQQAKSKRYALSRIRRLAAYGYLGLTAEDFSPELPYLRVLGFSERGRSLLPRIKKQGSLPLLTTASSLRSPTPNQAQAMLLEERASALWALCRRELAPTEGEWIAPVRRAEGSPC